MPPPQKQSLEDEFDIIQKPPKASDDERVNPSGATWNHFGNENIPPNNEDEQPVLVETNAVRNKTCASAKPSTHQPWSIVEKSSRSSLNDSQVEPSKIFGTSGSPSVAKSNKENDQRLVEANVETEVVEPFVFLEINSRGECHERSVRQPRGASAQCGATDSKSQEVAQREKQGRGMTSTQRLLMSAALDESPADEVEDFLIVVKDKREIFALEARSMTRAELLDKGQKLFKHFKIWIEFDVRVPRFRGWEPDLSFLSLTDHQHDQRIINSAWGEAAFLLKFLAGEFGCQFRLYEVIFHGAESSIKPLSYAAQGRSFERPLYLKEGADPATKAAYDRARSAFLQCMYELGEHIRVRYGDFTLAVPLDGSCNIEEQDNKPHVSPSGVLRLMLVNIKQILTYCDTKILSKRE